jgi:thymidylate synthase
VAENATDLYMEMVLAIRKHRFARDVADPQSPRQGLTYEAQLFQRFVLRSIYNNVVRCRPVDIRWAKANTLHFFADTEEAGTLRKYNKHADRFLTVDVWKGAYGAIAMPQIAEAVKRLFVYPDTRRAVVSMGRGDAEPTVNSPACWSFLHFARQGGLLCLGVYQRSLSLDVMPYDCFLLTNILDYVAWKVQMRPGSLVWTIGCFHASEEKLQQFTGITDHPASCLFDKMILDSPAKCREVLYNGLE